MSKGVINSITLDKTVILGSGSTEVTVDYTASGSGTFTLDDFVDSPGYLQNAFAEKQKLTAEVTEYDEGRPGDYFGWSVAISGNYAIVGAYGDDDNGTDSGSAYIFKKDETGTVAETWTQQQKLTVDDGSYDYKYFGTSVAISGDYAIVGAKGDYVGAGSAYIFKRVDSTWSQQTKISSMYTTNDNIGAASFGHSVDIDGDYVIVGANLDGDDDQGAAYIFKKDNGAETWTLQGNKLSGEDANDFFGYSVAISGDYAIVGARGYYNSNNSDYGAAYIYFKDQGSANNWGKQKKLTVGNAGTTSDQFGYSVAISRDYAIVGIHANNASYAGGAFIFKKEVTTGVETWTQQGNKLSASGGATNDHFGSSVAISGDYAIVGAPYNDGNGTNSGSAYIFNGQGITLTPPVNTISLKKLEIKTNNWTGVTESDYILINTYSGQGSGIMTAYQYEK